jgi:hypothetical protein
VTASVVLWSEFLATDPYVPGSTPGVTRFSEMCGFGTGFTQPREYNWATLKKSSGSGLENRAYGSGDPLRCPRDTHVADKRRSLERYRSLAD